jgi:ribosomal protein S18 acetylase RimI-like enzyme
MDVAAGESPTFCWGGRQSVSERVQLSPVADSEASAFLAMAKDYFKELNPNFVAGADWQASYFSRLKNSSDTHLNWIRCDGERAGFAIYGVEGHRFLPRKNGYVYEFYIQPRFRRSGIGREAAEQVLGALRQLEPARIQLEITSGNSIAAEFWQSFGFDKVAERYVLDQGSK